MELAAQLVTVLAPVFLVATLGYGWAKSGAPFNTAATAELVRRIGAPCLVFATLTTTTTDPAILGAEALAMGLCLLAFMAIGTVGLRLARLPTNVYLPPLIIPNVGNMGLPVCLFAYGQEGLAHGIAIFAMLNLVTFVLNPWIASGKASPIEALKQPALWSVAIAVVFLLSGASVPGWLADTTLLLGGIAIPLMLLALGVNIAELRITNLYRSLAMGIARPAMGFAVGVGVASLLGLEGVARGVLIIQCSMPPAVFTFLFAQIYDRRPQEVAGVIVTSTLMSCLTLPLILLFLLA